jgi:hypothetical protein
MKKRSSVRLLTSLAAGTLVDRGRAGRNTDGALGQGVLDLVNEVREFLSDERIVADNRKGVEHVALLGALVLGENLKVFMRLVEVFSLDSNHVVKLGFSGSVNSFNFLFSIAELSVDVLVDLNSFVVASLGVVTLIADFHELAGSSVEVRLHLLQFTSLAEEVLRSSSALVFEDLLAVKVGSLSSLHELVSVVLVSKFEMV